MDIVGGLFFFAVFFFVMYLIGRFYHDPNPPY
jgi:hypothetical protein